MSEDDKFKERLNRRITKLMNKDFMSFSYEEIKTLIDAMTVLQQMVKLDKPLFEKTIYILTGHNDLGATFRQKEFFKEIEIIQEKILTAL